MSIAPAFVFSSLMLLNTLEEEQVQGCDKIPPTMYKRTHRIPHSFMEYKREIESATT